MLEIIALIFLTRKIGRTAREKGLPAGRWQLYNVLAWIGAELIGYGVSMYLTDASIPMAMLTGFAFAFGGYLLVKYLLDRTPANMDNNDDWINNIGEGRDE